MLPRRITDEGRHHQAGHQIAKGRMEQAAGVHLFEHAPLLVGASARAYLEVRKVPQPDKG
ncbi:MAG: hypothetical protein WCE48_01250 [Steroidobacteraceae bacterium]